jgi:hypothetical protein
MRRDLARIQTQIQNLNEQTNLNKQRRNARIENDTSELAAQNIPEVY